MLIPSVIFGIGVIPAIFLILGIVLLKKNREFSAIESSYKAYQLYTSLLLLALVIAALYFGFEYIVTSEPQEPELPRDSAWQAWRRYDNDYLDYIRLKSFGVGCAGYAMLVAAYQFAARYLYFLPLNRHRQWVEKNGIFSSVELASAEGKSDSGDAKIRSSGGFGTYSVADELRKWADLREEGVVSEQEFQEARDTLLKRNK